MKTFLLSLVLATVSSAYAEVVTILEERVPGVSYNSRVSTKFYMNTTTGEGNATVTVTNTTNDFPRFPGPIGCDQWGRCYPDRNPMPTPRTTVLFEKTVPVRGLNLVNKRMIFSGNSGDTDCGYLGRSRVFNRPTLFLNGKCKLTGRLMGDSLAVKLMIR